MKIILDEISLLVTTSPDLFLKEIENFLTRQGTTLGYETEGPKELTLRQALEGQLPNRKHLYYGEIEDLCVSLKANSKGRTLVTRNIPRSATGPDFKKILIKSRGHFGKIEEVTFKVFHQPQKKEKMELKWNKPNLKTLFMKKFWSLGVRPLEMLHRPRILTIQLAGLGVIMDAERKAIMGLVTETRGQMREIYEG